MHCAELFSINNCEIGHFFREWQGVKPIQIDLRNHDLSLNGTAVFHEDGCLLAIRFVLSEKAFANGSLNLSDFGHSDPVVLNTMLIVLQKAMLEDAHATVLELARERESSADTFSRTSKVAGYMAHDFNNLLSIIQLNADRLLRLAKPNDTTTKLANIIHETACRGAQATASLMALSQQRTGTLNLISVDNIIKENFSILNSVVGSKVKLSLNLAAEKYKCVVESNELLSAIINLLINARDTLPNGGNISLSTAGGSEFSGERSHMGPVGDRNFLSIRVTDNGIGMSNALLSRAFEPRFSSKPNGTGLGLASVRNFLVERGGDVRLESKIGKGTTVHLHLPAQFDTADGGLPNKPNTTRILLAEDEPYALEAMAEMLEAEGYIVSSCQSGEEALEALEQETYDILLTDIVMPGLNGTEVAHRATANQPAIKVILMSGYVPDRASLQPGWRLLRKPIDKAELLQLISG